MDCPCEGNSPLPKFGCYVALDLEIDFIHVILLDSKRQSGWSQTKFKARSFLQAHSSVYSRSLATLHTRLPSTPSEVGRWFSHICLEYHRLTYRYLTLAAHIRSCGITKQRSQAIQHICALLFPRHYLITRLRRGEQRQACRNSKS